jgi:hypothetical protein
MGENYRNWRKPERYLKKTGPFQASKSNFSEITKNWAGWAACSGVP